MTALTRADRTVDATGRTARADRTPAEVSLPGWHDLVDEAGQTVWDTARAAGLAASDAAEVCELAWLRLAQRIAVPGGTSSRSAGSTKPAPAGGFPAIPTAAEARGTLQETVTTEATRLARRSRPATSRSTNQGSR